MAQIINTNIGSLTAQRNLNTTQNANLQALGRLSSGLRINSARDDAAGLAISTRFTAQVRGLNVAMRNAGDGISLAQTAEGALGAMTESLQRVRELALQAANATNSDSDRQALNAETQQLIAEITRISDQTNFNGRKLFNGTFSSSVQIGTNVGETVSFGVGKISADTLGGGIGTGVSARGTASALGNGDLTINGVSVGPSSATDDTASTANKAASAIAKAAAINRVSDATGVTAQVNANRQAGTAMVAAVTTGSVTLNGVVINVSTGGVDLAADRQSVVQSINARSQQTGVTAIDSGADNSGVILEAADGRNITVSFTGVTDAASGLAAAGTYEGGYTLVSKDGSDVVVGGGDNTGSGNVANSGLVAGVQGGTTAAVTSLARSATALTAMAAGDLVINGVTISASKANDDTASSVGNAASGIAIAAAINAATAQTGVKASVNATQVVGGAAQTTAASADTATVTINGVAATISIAAGATEVDNNRTNAINAINTISGQTGVVASDNGKTITLTAADGRNISVLVGAGGTLADTAVGTAIGLDTTTAGVGAGTADVTASTVNLKSAGAFTVAAGSGGNAGVSNAGLELGTFGGATNGQFLSEVDISTVKGAEKALSATDNALDSVNRERANLGAIQNRLDSTISTISINVENLSAARSRVLDADFARETAELSRTQILQQAGIAILAQANAQPQLVLSLLQ
jgi:flagellin